MGDFRNLPKSIETCAHRNILLCYNNKEKTYSSNSALSERLDKYSAQHTVKISNHAGLLKDLDQNHQRTAGRVEHVATQVGRLKDGVNLMEGRLRGEVKTKLEDVRSVLLTALSKAEESIKDIQEDVKRHCLKYLFCYWKYKYKFKK